MPDLPIAAVVIAAHNAEATIERCVRSVLAQDRVIEVCVVDDASNDRTSAVAQACGAGDRRVNIIRLDVNAGPSAARNAGIEHTTAPWVGIVDADDFLHEGRVAALLHHHAAADLIADDLLRVAPGQDERPAWNVGSVRRIGFAEFVKGNVAECSALDLGFLKPLIRRSFLNDHGLKFRDDMRLGEDFELYARALARGGRFILTSAKGYVSVETKGSLSKEHSESDLHRLREASHALRAIRPLSSAEARALRQHYDSVDKRLQWRRLITAVREHNVIDGVSTLTSGPVMAHLLARLGEQAWLRSRRLLPGPPPRSMFLEL